MAREDVRVEGMKTLQRNLEKLPVSLQRKYNKQAVRKGGGLVAKDARKRIKAPTKKQRERMGGRGRTGLLAKSLGTKVIGRSGQPRATAIVGPRKSIQGEGYGGRHVPANIAHLVELGHGGPAPAPPHPFLRPAFVATKTPVQKSIADTLWNGMRKEAVKP